MLAGASDASSSSHDRYTTTPEEQSPPPPGLPPPPPPPPPSTAAEKIRDGFMRSAGPSAAADSIVKIRLRNVDRVKIISTTLSGNHPNFAGPLWDNKETLRFIPAMPVPDNLLHTTMELNMLFASALRQKIQNNEMLHLSIHVLDFDFTLVKSEVLGRFTQANRDHYGSNRLRVFLTISSWFTLMWTPTKLKEWIDWRDSEDAAERELDIQYEVSSSFTLTLDELEGLRNFLHYNDLYGDKTGDMGKIMACFKDYFRDEYQRYGI